MPIVEIMGVTLAACGLSVIVMQRVEQLRLARARPAGASRDE